MATKKVAATTTTTNDKGSKLLKLANKRVPKAIKAISLIGNLVNYNPTPEQAKFIITALDKAVQQVEDRLMKKEASTESFQMQ